jgi:hypothetical protein
MGGATPDAVASGAEGLPLVPSGSISSTTSSPQAGVLQSAASTENRNDEHLSELPSPATQQPPTSGDGVYAAEQLCLYSKNLNRKCSLGFRK